MRISRIIGGIGSLGIGVYLWGAAAFVGWPLLGVRVSNAPTDITLGTIRLDGWQLWTALATFALVGVLLIIFGFYILSSRHKGG
jgi:hypothetical protein